jgi:RNA methyltransferase, TrmH family
MQNLVKHLLKLRKERKYREETGLALVTGLNMLKELGDIQTIISVEPVSIPCKEEILLPMHAIKKFTGLDNPEGVAATVCIPEMADLTKAKRVIVLDRVTDPGNMGTLLRTAKALGFDGAYLLPGCVDPFNEKALRAAKGATFSLPLSKDPLPEHFHLYLADGKGAANVAFHTPMALVLGNEACGIDPTLQGTRVAIPMQEFESLNVAVAGGILMHQMREVLCAK